MLAQNICLIQSNSM